MLSKENILSFEQLKEKYSSKNFLCEKGYFGYLYSYRQDKVYTLPCNNYSCRKCRPGLKADLHNKICQQVDSNELNYHMVLTFPGKETREQIPYYQSYDVMNYDWNLLSRVIRYKYPDFRYIIFPRAQANPTPGNPAGYCHFHVIHNQEINKGWLDEKTKKYTLGYNYLSFNEDVAGYLHNDFYVDDEWIIPSTIKHYRSSRNILINPGLGYQKDVDSLYFTKKLKIDKLEKLIEKKYSRILPFEEYVKQFVELEKKV